MLHPYFKIDVRIQEAAEKAAQMTEQTFRKIDKTTEYNQQKMMAAFAQAGVSESHFVASTGYGYGDRGRDTLDLVYAKAFDAPDALVRHNLSAERTRLRLPCLVFCVRVIPCSV